jgi:hypothetical protein
MNRVPKVTLFEGHKAYFFAVTIERLVKSWLLILGPKICSSSPCFPMPLDLSQHFSVGSLAKNEEIRES